MRLGLNLRVNLIVVPLVAAMLALALAPIGSFVRLRAAVSDVRRELAFVLHLCRFDIQTVRLSVEYFGVAFRDESPDEIEALADGGRATLDSLATLELAPRQAERLEHIDQAFVRLAAAGDRAVELARRGERGAATDLFTETIEEQRDAELLPLVDAAQLEGSLALRKALDSLLGTSAQLALVPLVGLETDANSLREEAAEAVSLARFARQAQRLLGKVRSFAYFGHSRDGLAVAGREFDQAYRVWRAQVAARGGHDRTTAAPEPAGMAEVGDEVRAVRQAVERLGGIDDPEGERAEIVRLYESRLESLGNRSLPRILTAAFDAHDARISALLDSIARRSRLVGIAVAAFGALVLGLALLCPWLISRWIVRPVLALTRATRELGAGGGGGPVAVRAGGEIAELAASFNRMAEQLAERTRELEAERARERLRHAERLASLGSLASGLAHQINNPLNNILLTAQNALDEEGPEAAGTWRDALVAGAEEARRCERIVRGLVAFARGEPGQEWREDANQVLRRACELTAGTAAEHQATVDLELDRQPAPVLANPIALEQALVNVVRNAIQSRHRARVTVRSERLARSVRIEIEDDGRGMDRAALGRLFDPFYTTRADVGGIGLGLSVAHRIIADHGGEIRVASQPGEGTTFTVDLPLDLSGDGPQ